MTQHSLDITGKICPYCLLFVKKKLATIGDNDSLVVKLDHPLAATDTIPRAMKKMDYPTESKILVTGLWELTISKH